MVTATLDATETEDALVLELTVENDEDDPVSFQFSDTQRAEFVAEDDGGEVWRWSEGRMFGQMLGSVDLDPGQSETFEGGWENPPSGEYTITGSLAANNSSASDQITVTVN
jgi:hypothetical protein